MSSKDNNMPFCDRSDIYIMVPCHAEDGKKNFCSTMPMPSTLTNQFLKTFDHTSKYDCSSEIANKIHRSYLGDFEFACSDNNYEITFPMKLLPHRCLSRFRGSLFFSTYRETGLSILFLSIPQVEYNITLLADQISMEYLYLCDPQQGEFIIWRDFLKNHFGIIPTDVPRALFVLPKQSISSSRLKNLLAGDADDGYLDKYDRYHIRSRKVKSEAQTNIAVYDFYSAYCSSRFLACILNNFSEEYANNLEKEIDMLFICELILFQIAAITRTNQEILDGLSSPTKLTLKTIEAMHTQFGKTVHLWNNNNFKYTQVQELASSIQAAFGIPELLNTYYCNQDYLEHMVNIKRSISAEKEGKVINFLALLLAAIQVIPILTAWFSFPALVSLFSIILIILIWYLYQRNKTRY